MARVTFLTRVIDEAGNGIGGSPTEVRIYDDFAATAATVVTADSAGAITIAQPITPNAGTQTTLTVTTAAVDTTITVASTTGFAVGHLVPIYDGTTTRYRWITAILAGPPRLTLESAIGVIFSSANTTIGNPDMTGVIAGYVSDATFHYIQTKDVGSTRVMPATLIPTMIGSSSVAVGEEGATVGTRSLINFIGTTVTAVDNAGAARVDVTLVAAAPADVQVFTASGTWTKPTAYTPKLVEVFCFGAGGSGGGNSSGSLSMGGGGGGALVRRVFPASTLGATEVVTIGAGGAGQGTADTAGNAGGTTTFGAHVSAYGGAGGASGAAMAAGGAGGGAGGAGSGVVGGRPNVATGAIDASGAGGANGGAASAVGRAAEYGGGGGGGGTSAGGTAIYGGGGGGGGGANGGASGGASGSGGGGATGNPGLGGTSRSGTGKAGDGGGGAGLSTGSAGGAGGAPAGGGGGCSGNIGTSGAGARGEIIVVTTF